MNDLQMNYRKFWTDLFLHLIKETKVLGWILIFSVVILLILFGWLIYSILHLEYRVHGDLIEIKQEIHLFQDKCLEQLQELNSNMKVLKEKMITGGKESRWRQTWKFFPS